jgi:hypothetical protein
MDQLRLEPPGRLVLVVLEPELPPPFPPVLAPLPADDEPDRPADCPDADCVVPD